MSTLVEIESAIQNLSPNELNEFRGWFADYNMKTWDNQLLGDIQNGRLDTLAQEALDEFSSGAGTEI